MGITTSPPPPIRPTHQDELGNGYIVNKNGEFKLVRQIYPENPKLEEKAKFFWISVVGVGVGLLAMVVSGVFGR